jgi:hypothetical protein
MKLKDYKRCLHKWVERYQSFCDLLCPALAQEQRATDVVHRGDSPFAEVWYLTHETLILQARIQRMLHAIEALWGDSESRWIQRMRAKVQRNERRLNEHRQVLASLMDFIWERSLQEEKEIAEEEGRLWVIAPDGQGNYELSDNQKGDGQARAAALEGQPDATKSLFYRLIRLKEELPLLAKACHHMELPYPQETIEALKTARVINSSAPSAVLIRAYRHFRFYRVSNLLVSWLEQPQSWEGGKMHEIVERLPENMNLS